MASRRNQSNRFRSVSQSLLIGFATLAVAIAAPGVEAAPESSAIANSEPTMPKMIWMFELYENRDLDGDGFIGPPPTATL